MKLTDFKLLADENIEPKVVEFLRSAKFDITYISEIGWRGRKDIDILIEATAQNRVVVTQDDDFVKIVFTTSTPFIGIIYLRPEHFFPERTIISLQDLFTHDELDFPIPFILVVEDKISYVKIRLRPVRRYTNNNLPILMIIFSLIKANFLRNNELFKRSST